MRACFSCTESTGLSEITQLKNRAKTPRPWRAMPFYVRAGMAWRYLAVPSPEGPTELPCHSFLATGPIGLVFPGAIFRQIACFSMEFHLKIQNY